MNESKKIVLRQAIDTLHTQFNEVPGPGDDGDWQSAFANAFADALATIQAIAAPLLEPPERAKLANLRVDARTMEDTYKVLPELRALSYDIKEALDAVDALPQAALSAGPRRIISERVICAFEDVMPQHGTNWTITRAFSSEGFDCGPTVEAGGERRSTYRSHTAMIDWTDEDQVRRALNVFETFVSWLGPEDEYVAPLRAEINRTLAKDGYEVSPDGAIVRSLRALRDLPLGQLRDARAIEEHLDRLGGALQSDPPLAISQAKALLEATCKHILEELGIEYGATDSTPKLLKSVQKALKVHPDDIAPTAKGRDSVVKVLAGLGQMSVGLAELRNEYGPDHGSTTPTTGLGPRHAELAVGASQTACRFLLQTLARRRAAP